jgi:Pyruvate/2-oxoacid:ferredoxin oxidoreductase delta subunit
MSKFKRYLKLMPFYFILVVCPKTKEMPCPTSLISNYASLWISSPEIVKKADESGLVHAGANAKHLSNICNCCPCCCASMKGIVAKDHDRQKFMNALFEAVVDEDQCTACEICLERCPVDAISVEDTALVDRDKCLGCGLCAGDCSMEAIAMHLREDRQEPFERVFDMGVAMLKAKQANAAGRG